MLKALRIQSRVSFLAAGAFLCVACGLTGCAQDIDDLRVQAIEQFRSRQYIESTATLRQILEIEHNDAEGNYYMGLNYRAMAARKFREGDVPAARRELDTSVIYFTQAIKSWPNYMAAVDAKNEALEARGKYEEALEVTQRVARNNRGVSEHFVVLANEYRERGDYDNALRCYKLALSTSPDSSRAYSEMGRLYLRVGDRALALDAFRKAYEMNSAEPGVADTLAQLDVDYGTYTASHNEPPARPTVTPAP